MAGTDSEASGRLPGLRTPRAAGVTGIVFAGLFATVVVLDLVAFGGRPGADDIDLTKVNTTLVIVSTHLVAFAGVFFLWFVGVARSRLGASEDQFFATVFLGSGILFVASLFTAAAVGAAGVTQLQDDSSRAIETVRLANDVGYALSYVFAAKMAGVFMAVFTTMLTRVARPPLWLTIAGYVGALVLLFTIPRVEWLLLVFPVWVFVVSVDLLRVGLHGPTPQNE